MKKYFNKEFVVSKEDNEDFQNSPERWICDDDYVDNDIKVGYPCHNFRKYRGSARRGCNINVRLNLKIPVIFCNLKNYDSHHIMQKLGKFNLKLNIIPNGLEKYMGFSINNKLSFIESLQYLSSSLDSLVKNVTKDNFKYFNQEFYNNVLNMAKQKGFYPFEYMINFENENHLAKKSFIVY